MPSRASIWVRFPSFREKITGALSHPMPYTIGAGSLYFAEFSSNGETCDVLSPAVRTMIAEGTNSNPPKRRVILPDASVSNIPRAWHDARDLSQEVYACP